MDASALPPGDGDSLPVQLCFPQDRLVAAPKQLLSGRQPLMEQRPKALRGASRRIRRDRGAGVGLEAALRDLVLMTDSTMATSSTAPSITAPIPHRLKCQLLWRDRLLSG